MYVDSRLITRSDKSWVAMISSALRTGYPLPQITPCPLLDRSMSIYQGLDVIQKEAGENYGLPRTLNLETLQNEQYL
jgi:Aromatic acid exporter family member 2